MKFMSERSIFYCGLYVKRAAVFQEICQLTASISPLLLLNVDWMFPLRIKSLMNAGLIIFFFLRNKC